jgi:hypothetical protein
VQRNKSDVSWLRGEMMRLRSGLILVAALVLCGCASIPLSTALHLASLKPHTLAQVDPAQVRVKVSVPAGYEINVRASRLMLRISGPGGSRTAAIHLNLLAVSEESLRPGRFRANVPVSTYLLDLSDGGVRQLRELQQFMLATGPGSFEFSVSAHISKSPPNAREVTLWVALKLYADKPFMPLIDGATLKYNVRESGS